MYSIYGVGVANGDGGTDGQEIDLPAIPCQAGETFWLLRDPDSYRKYFGDIMGSVDESHVVSTSLNLSGDDSIELFMNGQVADLYGEVGVDGSNDPWEYKDAWANRKCEVTGPNPVFDLDEWEIATPDCSDDSTSNADSSCPYPIAGCGPCAGTGVALRLKSNEQYCDGYAPSDWHGSIDMSAYDNNAVCEVLATTGGQTCRQWCNARGFSCHHAQDNTGSTCNLDENHERKTTDNNGCDQGWGGQICGCGVFGGLGSVDWVDPLLPPAPGMVMIKGVLDLSVPSCFCDAGGSAGRGIELIATEDVPDLRCVSCYQIHS